MSCICIKLHKEAQVPDLCVLLIRLEGRKNTNVNWTRQLWKRPYALGQSFHCLCIPTRCFVSECAWRNYIQLPWRWHSHTSRVRHTSGQWSSDSSVSFPECPCTEATSQSDWPNWINCTSYNHITSSFACVWVRSSSSPESQGNRGILRCVSFTNRVIY